MLTEPEENCKSGRRDSNSRPPAPKAGALTKLRYAPSTIFSLDELPPSDNLPAPQVHSSTTANDPSTFRLVLDSTHHRAPLATTWYSLPSTRYIRS